MTNKIEFTKEANKQIARITSEQGKDCYFRISVQGGGCSGFKYNFSFDKKIEKNDIIFDKSVIDRNSKITIFSLFRYNSLYLAISFFCKFNFISHI